MLPEFVVNTLKGNTFVKDSFLKYLSDNNLDNIVNVRDVDDFHIMVCNQYKPNTKFINNDYWFYNSLVYTKFDDEYKLSMYSGPMLKNNLRDNINSNILSDYQDKIYESIEGTQVNIYYDNKWNISTKRCFDINESKYGSDLTHGNMLDDIIDRSKLFSKLDTNKTYHFVLVHKDNMHLIDVKENCLYLIAVRDKLNNFEKVNIDLTEFKDFDTIKYPKEVTIKEFEEWNNKLDHQGIIIFKDDHIYKLYTKEYIEKYKENPLIYNLLEKYIYKFQHNKLSKDNEYVHIVNLFKLLNSLLYNMINHFTEYNEMNGTITYIKKNNEDYDKLTGPLKYILNYLQNLPNILKQKTITYDQIKIHIKYHMSYSEIRTIITGFFMVYEKNQLQFFRYKSDKYLSSEEYSRELKKYLYIFNDVRNYIKKFN